MVEKKKTTKKKPEKKAPVKKTAAEVLKPDVTIVIEGETGIGKDVIQNLIVKTLNNANLGLVCYAKAPNTLIDNFKRIHKEDIVPKPEWDTKVRKVLLKQKAWK